MTQNLTPDPGSDAGVITITVEVVTLVFATECADDVTVILNIYPPFRP